MEKRKSRERKRGIFDSKNLSGVGSSRRFLKNTVAKSFGKLSELFIYSSTRSYGALCLSYGVITLLLHFGTGYFSSGFKPEVSVLVIGAIFSALSVPVRAP